MSIPNTLDIRKMISEQILSQIIPNNKSPNDWFASLSLWLPKYDITSNNRLAAFLSQTIYESAGYTELQEDLCYSAASLLKVFPSHFTTVTVNNYADQPQKIANCVYANRYGNGDEASGDGWNYSGKGVIQLTFKANYKSCSMFLYGDDRLVQTPTLLLQANDAISSACWFWTSHNLNALADQGNINGITEVVNGGLNGSTARSDLYQKILSLL